MDLAQRWRAENRAVISGFHTAVEKECLRIFLRGPQPLVICPARGLDPFQLPATGNQNSTVANLLFFHHLIRLFVDRQKRPPKFAINSVIDLSEKGYDHSRFARRTPASPARNARQLILAKSSAPSARQG